MIINCGPHPAAPVGSRGLQIPDGDYLPSISSVCFALPEYFGESERTAAASMPRTTIVIAPEEFSRIAAASRERIAITDPKSNRRLPCGSR